MGTPATRGINVRLGDDPATSVHLRVAERAGELHLDVRAANAELAGTLRQSLPDLMKSLQNNGYQAEIRQPDPTFQTASGNGAGNH